MNTKTLKQILGAASFAALASACGDEGGDNVIPLGDLLVVPTTVDPGDLCPNGGVALQIGADGNGNGLLDSDEVEQTTNPICNPSLGAPTVVRTVVLPVGDSDCPNGGAIIESGGDDNGNGALDDDEVDVRGTPICNPEIPDDPMHEVLVQNVPLPAGDDDCPNGGSRVEVGLDDGAGVATADDGILGADEVDSTTFLCNDGPERPDTAPPAGDVGDKVVDLRGGDCGDCDGDVGGSIHVVGIEGSSSSSSFPSPFPSPSFEGAVLNAPIVIASTGSVDATAPAPSFQSDLGAVSVSVSGDVDVAYDPETIADGDLFVLSGSRFDLRVRRGGEDVVVTGLEVLAGATLRLPTEVTRLDFTGDVIVDGTIEAGADQSIAIDASNVHLRSTGVLRNAAGDGSAANASIFASGLLIVEGDIDVRRVSGTFTQPSITLEGGRGLYVASTLDTRGLSRTGDTGTHAGDISLRAYGGSLQVLGDVLASGGDGDDGPGTGGEISLQARSLLGTPTLVSGTLDASGGALNACPAMGTCNAGRGGNVSFTTVSGDIRVSGDIDTSGGDATVGNGQRAGHITFSVIGSTRGDLALQNFASEIELGGDLRARGGDGPDDSGAGGDLYFSHVGGIGSIIRLLGYADVMLDGGASETSQAGRAGSLEYGIGSGVGPGGSGLTLTSDFSAVGGSGQQGGSGGAIIVALVESGGFFGPPGAVVDTGVSGFVSNATISLDGGAGQASSGGTGGEVLYLGAGGFTLEGAVSTRGGNSSASSGGGAGSVVLYGLSGACEASAALTVSGGDGSDGAGGAGTQCSEFLCAGASFSSDIGATGGAGVGDGGAAAGGAGGRVFLLDTNGNTTYTGTADVTGGEGGAAGELGVGVSVSCLGD